MPSRWSGSSILISLLELVMGRCLALKGVGPPRGTVAELLERRVMLSASLSDFKHGPLTRIGSDLGNAYIDFVASQTKAKTKAAGGATAATSGAVAGAALTSGTSTNPLLHVTAGLVQVEAYARRSGVCTRG